QSFKRHQFNVGPTIAPLTATGLNNVGVPTYTGELPQDVPGFAYNTESGFQPSTTGTNYTTYSSGAVPGAALAGTRFLIRFNNVGAGARLVLPVFVPLVTSGCTPGNPNPPSSGLTAPCAASATNTGGTWTGGFLQLIGTSDLNGNIGSFNNGFGGGPGTTVSGGSTFTGDTSFVSGTNLGGSFADAVELTFTAPTAAAVYEVINEDPSAIEQATIAVGVAFTSNTPNNLPALGQVTENASFAPLSTIGTAATLSNSAPVPRFCDKSAALNTFIINQCVCNLLFPFVTQAPGFDTGIAIANTSLDNINGVTPQTGTVRMDFYGTTTGGAAVSPASLQSRTTTAPVPAGQVLTFTLFGGAGANAAGLQAVPGFTGYIVARATFQWCHGFAFISDLGAQKLAEGYLAIQLDVYG